MPLTSAFRKDLGDLKSIAITNRDYVGAKTFIENLLLTPERYAEQEVILLRHALVHLESILTETGESEQIQINKVGRILNNDANTI